MSTKKYITLSNLGTFLDKLKTKFALLTHIHKISDLTATEDDAGKTLTVNSSGIPEWVEVASDVVRVVITETYIIDDDSGEPVYSYKSSMDFESIIAAVKAGNTVTAVLDGRYDEQFTKTIMHMSTYTYYDGDMPSNESVTFSAISIGGINAFINQVDIDGYDSVSYTTKTISI